MSAAKKLLEACHKVGIHSPEDLQKQLSMAVVLGAVADESSLTARIAKVGAARGLDGVAAFELVLRAGLEALEREA